MGTHSLDDLEQSLVRWADTVLPSYPEDIAAFRKRVGILYADAAAAQVATKGLEEAIAEVESLFGQAEARAQGLYQRCVAQHPRPFQRARTPRVSPKAEKQVDHGYTSRDM